MVGKRLSGLLEHRKQPRFWPITGVVPSSKASLQQTSRVIFGDFFLLSGREDGGARHGHRVRAFASSAARHEQSSEFAAGRVECGAPVRGSDRGRFAAR